MTQYLKAISFSRGASKQIQEHGKERQWAYLGQNRREVLSVYGICSLAIMCQFSDVYLPQVVQATREVIQSVKGMHSTFANETEIKAREEKKKRSPLPQE